MKVNTWVRLESSGLCSLYIDSINYSDLTSTVILGYAFMKNYYIYYDINNTRIGFYPSSVDCDESLPEDCGQSSEGYLSTKISLSLLILTLMFFAVF